MTGGEGRLLGFLSRHLTPKRRRTAAVVAGVTAAHLAVFAAILLSRAPDPPVTPSPPIEVSLVTPPPPPPPPPPPAPPAPEAGGGAPAAPSRVRLPPPPPEPPPPVIIAAPEPAPEPSPAVGAAPIESPTPGLGQGGQGTGTGAGTGPGAGPGEGGTRARLISGPSRDQIRRLQPRGGLGVRRVGRGVMTCRIRLDGRLEACRLVSETPPGNGLGRATLAAAVHFRFQPPTAGGRPIDGQEITVGVDFLP